MPQPPMPMPKSVAEAEEEAKHIKEEADENNISEEQFFRCFSQVNCELGPGPKQEMFDCYFKPNLEERLEYVQWFKECPVGEFPNYTPEDVNDVFCAMNEKDQRTLNEFFLEQGTQNVKTICENPANRQKCMRIKDGAQCISVLLEKYVANGQCDTFAQDIPSNPMAM
ncbi:uncharacterized protein NPIL_699661 [Nephila pilipes]|uniref:Uncharacterized protein n=1 Tax=Nephila pilipes TaxID=299642 RepID=A0A8X6Q8M2_NEPPI|nr:uncharacterized protein NPIL_699661 [Nephila pilipes]